MDRVERGSLFTGVEGGTTHISRGKTLKCTRKGSGTDKKTRAVESRRLGDTVRGVRLGVPDNPTKQLLFKTSFNFIKHCRIFVYLLLPRVGLYD